MTADTIVLVGRNGSATSTDTIITRARRTGSEITYQAEIQMHGPAGKLASPLVKLIFEKVGHDAALQLTDVLNAL